jgi:glycosyltransferase involved in cell wall biosynthesis
VTLVSVVIPCRDEERRIAGCLESVLGFAVPAGGDLEVWAVDGMSADATAAIAGAIAARDPRVRVRANPGVTPSAAMNLALREAAGDWVMRLDAHARYPRDYLEVCLETARRTGADNVGGVVVTRPGDDSYQAALVQALTTHRFGVGDSGFRVGAAEGPADTVPFGFFRRDALARVGDFDERLVRAQDYELNRRIAARGGRVWRNPAISADYYNMPTLAGFYRKQVVKEAPYNTYMWWVAPYAFTPRHAVTGAFAAGVIGGGLLAGSFPRLRPLYHGVLALYALLAVLASAQQAARYRDARHVLCLPWCFAGFHLFHGLGILAGLARLATGTAPVQRR